MSKVANFGAVSRFNEIYNSTQGAALAYITGKCGCFADISDIFQDVYMELYQVLCKRGADYIKSEKAFVIRLAKRKLARYYAFKKRRNETLVYYESENEAGFTAAEADTFLTEDFVADSVTLDKARALIGAKPDDVKKIFFLHYDAGLSLAEIARKLNMSESNVKNKLYRTLKELRDLLK